MDTGSEFGSKCVQKKNDSLDKKVPRNHSAMSIVSFKQKLHFELSSKAFPHDESGSWYCLFFLMQKSVQIEGDWFSPLENLSGKLSEEENGDLWKRTEHQLLSEHLLYDAH